MLLALLVVLPLLLRLELLLAHRAVQVLLRRLFPRLGLLLFLNLPGQPLGRLSLRPIRLDVRARRLLPRLLRRRALTLRRRRPRLLQLGLLRGVRDVSFVSLAHKRDELPDGVVELARLPASQFLVFLIHQASYLAVLSFREVVLVRPRERLQRGEESPVRVEGFDLNPRRIRRPERWRGFEVVLARGE